MNKKLSQKDFENKFYKLYKEKFVVRGQYVNAITPVEIECCLCGYTLFRTPNNLDKGRASCPVCNKNGNTLITIQGINDMWTTHPHIAKLLKNPEDGYKFRFSTDKALEFICPNCFRIKKCVPRSLKNHFICNYCSDSFSYPNKYMANILDLLGIDFIPEYSFQNSLFRYDFRFEYHRKLYLIEMDGGLGHGQTELKTRSKQQQIENDLAKTKLAEQNGYILIRIDCDYPKVETRKQYIEFQIKQSLLHNLLSISQNIYDQADLLSQDSKIVKFSKSWNNGVRSYDEFKHILHVGRSTIRKYAMIASSLNMIDVSYDIFLKQIRKSSNIKLAKTKGSPVLCEQTGEVFYSIAEAERRMNITSLRTYFTYGRTFCGKLPNGMPLTWKKISKEEYIKKSSINSLKGEKNVC